MKKIVTLDLYKALGAILVIFIHITATPAVTLKEGPFMWLMIGVNRFSNPAVPMFIFASGMALVYSYQGKIFRFSEFISRRFTKILIPYLIWCLIYYSIYAASGVYPLSFTFFVKQVISGNMIYHLYFVVIIIQFYLLFWFFLQITRRCSGTWVLPVSLLVSLVSMKLVPMELTARCFLTYLVYFMLGCYFGKHAERAAALLSAHKGLVCVGFAGFGAIYAWRFYLYQVLGGFSTGLFSDSTVYILFCTMGVLFYYLASEMFERRFGDGDGWCRRGLVRISGGSYYIYLAHPLMIVISGWLCRKAGIDGVLMQMAAAFLMIYGVVVPLSVLYAEKTAAWRKNRKQLKQGVEK